MCTTTDSGSDGSNASLVISATSERFSSYLCDPVSPRVHLRMKFVVGTMMHLPAYGLNAYLPGRSPSLHTPRVPLSTSSPCLYSAPETSAPASPVYDTTTPTLPTSTTVFGAISTVANSRLM